MNTTLIVIAVVVVAVILMYNSLVAKKNEVDNVYAGLDAVLKKRYDLIPNLVSIAKEYMEYEKELLSEITKLRSHAINPNISEKEKIRLDKEITSKLGSIMVAVENYPELKANENMLHLQKTLTEVEAQISAARRAYNQAVTDYNNALEMIPTNVMASFMGYRKKELFEISDDERKSIDVSKLFNK